MLPKILFVCFFYVFPIYAQSDVDLESSEVAIEASKLYNTIVTFVKSSTLPDEFNKHFENFTKHILELDTLSFRIFDRHLDVAFFDRSQDLLIKSLTQLGVNFTNSKIKKTEILKNFTEQLIDQIDLLISQSENPYFNFLMVSFISYPNLYTRSEPNTLLSELDAVKTFMGLSSGGLMAGSFEDYFKEYYGNLITSNISHHFKNIEKYFKNGPMPPSSSFSHYSAIIASELNPTFITSKVSLNLLLDFIGYLHLTTKELLPLRTLIQRISSHENFTSKDYEEILEILRNLQVVLEKETSSQDTIHPISPEYTLSEMSGLVKLSFRSFLSTTIPLMEKEQLNLSE
jgi:hypothetical protein